MAPILAKRFSRKFYDRPASIVAKDLLGKHLHRIYDGEELIGRIVETEAYGVGDAACHAFRGKTPRNAVLFGEPGFSYVYFTYGMYHCFNVSCAEEHVAEAVLVRGIEPIAGIETMKRLRPQAKRERDLTNGPGKICQAFGLDRRDNNIDLESSEQLFITNGDRIPPDQILTSTRIGITVAKEYQWRFFVKDNLYVSPGKPSV
jgi:DNA-3-methyladenine glycosylase